MTDMTTAPDYGDQRLQRGAEWRFCYSDGRRTPYVLERTYGIGMSRLLNPQTGRYAQVSLSWLLEGPVGCGGYWTPGATR